MSRTTDRQPKPRVGTERVIELWDSTKKSFVSLEDDPDYVARLEVRHDGTMWRYGVGSDCRVTFLDARDQDGNHVEAAEPGWMYGVFQQIGGEDR